MNSSIEMVWTLNHAKNNYLYIEIFLFSYFILFLYLK